MNIYYVRHIYIRRRAQPNCFIKLPNFPVHWLQDVRGCLTCVSPIAAVNLSMYVHRIGAVHKHVDIDAYVRMLTVNM
jgi:hypothetical protein